jgi:beta-lactamase class A
LDRYQPLLFTTDRALEKVVRQSMGEDEERFAVVVKNLADGRGVELAADREFYAASLFKTWVMLAAYHQREAGLLDFDERYVVSDYYEEHALNPGELAACDEIPVREALERMLRVSDNVAANLLLDRVGAGNVNATLRSLGLAASGFPADGSLPTTAGEMALLLEAIARRNAVSEAASEEMLAVLSSESIANRLPALLPEGIVVAHKTGSWQDATHDAGIIFSPRATYVIVVLTDFGFADDGAGRIARLSRAVYDYYNQG